MYDTLHCFIDLLEFVQLSSILGSSLTLRRLKIEAVTQEAKLRLNLCVYLKAGRLKDRRHLPRL